MEHFEKDAFKPIGKVPLNVVVVGCRATLINLDSNVDEYGNKDTMIWHTMAGGSDIADKSVSGASTLAFRNWFDKNFTPKYMNSIDDDIMPVNEDKTAEPKIPTYIPPERKENMVKEMASNEQTSEDKDIKRVIDKIMEVRGLLQKDDWGAKTLESLITGNISAPELLSKELKIDNKLATLKEDN